MRGRGEPLFEKVSHFPADKPDPRPAHVFAGRGSRARVLRAGAPPLRLQRLFPPTRIRPRRAGGDSGSRHRLELAKWRRRRRGGSADTRKGRPAAASERDRGGRAEAAPRRAHTHTRAHTPARARSHYHHPAQSVAGNLSPAPSHCRLRPPGITPISLRTFQFAVIHTVKGFSIVNEVEAIFYLHCFGL